MRSRRDFVHAILILSVIWIAVVVLLAQWQRRAAPQGPPLLHYPGTEDRTEQTLPTLGSRKYWFTLREDYPSTAVFDFYQKELAVRGWRPLWQYPPKWEREPQQREDEAHDTFSAMWVSQDRLYQLQLQMDSTVTLVRRGKEVVSGKRQPGIKVYVTQQRSTGPWLLEPKRTPPGPSIEMKGTEK